MSVRSIIASIFLFGFSLVAFAYADSPACVDAKHKYNNETFKSPAACNEAVDDMQRKCGGADGEWSTQRKYCPTVQTHPERRAGVALVWRMAACIPNEGHSLSKILLINGVTEQDAMANLGQQCGLKYNHLVEVAKCSVGFFATIGGEASCYGTDAGNGCVVAGSCGASTVAAAVSGLAKAALKNAGLQGPEVVKAMNSGIDLGRLDGNGWARCIEVGASPDGRVFVRDPKYGTGRLSCRVYKSVGSDKPAELLESCDGDQQDCLAWIKRNFYGKH